MRRKSDQDLIIGLSSEMRDFVHTILFEDRFFIDHPVIKRLEKNLSRVDKDPLILFRHLIPKGSVLYRARLCDDTFISKNHNIIYDILFGGPRPVRVLNFDTKHTIESKFNGYDAKNSFVPRSQENISDGRANPKYIRYLYAADDKYTALVEVRPTLESFVSIAEIKVKENLSLLMIDPLRVVPTNRKIEMGDYFYSPIERENFEDFRLGWDLEALFSKPSSGSLKDYLPTQYITERIKSFAAEKGNFDGIEFRSSLNKEGTNFTIFNYKKCAPVASDLYKVCSIKYCGYGVTSSNLNDELTGK